MLNIVLTEFQKVKRYQILLIGMIGMTLSPVLGLITQNVAIPEAQIPDFNISALVDSTIWNNATVFMPVIFTLIGGYLINREYADNTLKNILTVPVSFSKLLTGKLAAVGLLSLLLGIYSFIVTIIVGICAGLPGMSISALTSGLLYMAGISICIYIAVLPILSLCGRMPGLFMGGSVIAFVAGYCSMFFKSGLLRSIYPFLAAFTVIGFDAASYINAKDSANVPLGLASLGTMLLLSVLIITVSKTPGETKTKHKRSNILLRPAQRERLKMLSLVLVCTLAAGLSLTGCSKDESIH